MRDGAGRRAATSRPKSSFQFLKDLQTQNLVVPVVGNFGGPKALRAIGKYLREHGGATVTAFYVSNVEQYLRQDGLWTAFCENVAALPLDARSTFVRSRRGGGGRGVAAPAAGPGPGMFASELAQIEADTRTCGAPALGRPLAEIARMAARAVRAARDARLHAPAASLFAATLALAVSVGAWSPGAGAGAARRATLPARLTDGEFWRLIEDFSEPNGFFRSDNLVSNEDTFQFVIPRAAAQIVKPTASISASAPTRTSPTSWRCSRASRSSPTSAAATCTCT